MELNELQEWIEVSRTGTAILALSKLRKELSARGYWTENIQEALMASPVIRADCERFMAYATNPKYAYVRDVADGVGSSSVLSLVGGTI